MICQASYLHWFSFFKDITRIFSNSYSPSEEDMLYLNRADFGLVREYVVEIEATTYRLINNVRMFRRTARKAMHYFWDVTALLYTIDMSAYDEVLIENESVVSVHLILTGHHSNTSDHNEREPRHV
jgi:hypothetical protein